MEPALLSFGMSGWSSSISAIGASSASSTSVLVLNRPGIPLDARAPCSVWNRHVPCRPDRSVMRPVVIDSTRRAEIPRDDGRLPFVRAAMEPSSAAHRPSTSRAQRPTVTVSLSRVGVTGVEKVIRIGAHGAEQLFSRQARVLRRPRARSRRARTCRASRRSSTRPSARSSSASAASGPRSSRSASPSSCASARTRARAEVTIAARYPEHKPAPVSGIQTQEIYTLFGSAVASERGTRRLVGVAAQGMTACPCAQELVAGSARERAARRRLHRRRDRAHLRRTSPSRRTTSAASARCTSAAPRTATPTIDAAHAAGDRRGLDVLGDLRADEALRRGRGRREGPPPPALRRGLRARDDRRRRRASFGGSADGAFVSARQENLETIHQHNVVAERFGLLGELRRELRQRRAPRAPHVDARVARRQLLKQCRHRHEVGSRASVMGGAVSPRHGGPMRIRITATAVMATALLAIAATPSLANTFFQKAPSDDAKPRGRHGRHRLRHPRRRRAAPTPRSTCTATTQPRSARGTASTSCPTRATARRSCSSTPTARPTGAHDLQVFHDTLLPERARTRTTTQVCKNNSKSYNSSDATASRARRPRRAGPARRRSTSSGPTRSRPHAHIVLLARAAGRDAGRPGLPEPVQGDQRRDRRLPRRGPCSRRASA